MNLKSNNFLKALQHFGWSDGTIWQIIETSGLTVDEIHNSTNIIRSIQEREGIKLPKRYRHDCDLCQFLGQYKEYDLYYCNSEPTIICRFSSNGPDYKSGLVFALTVDYPASPEYVECLKRALLFRESRLTIIKYFTTLEPLYLNNLNLILKEAGYALI